MNWNNLNALAQFENLNAESTRQAILIFKHSTRCSISSNALSRLERNWQATDDQKIKPYFLDLLSHRSISDFVSTLYKIEHQSPQILIIKNGKCVFSSSHLDINYSEIIQKAISLN